MNRKIYKQLAKKHGVSVEEIKQEMQRAINLAYEQPTDAAKGVKRKGVIPTVDEFIRHAAIDAKGRETAEKALVIDSSLNRIIMDLFDSIGGLVFPDETTLTEFKGKAIDQLHEYHFGLGLYLRNNVLKSDSELYKAFVENGVTHTDDMSAAIIRLWHTSLQ